MRTSQENSTKRLVVGALVLALLVPSRLCWHEVGHFSTAYIAQQYLLEKNYDAYQWAVSLLVPFTNVCGENLYPFVECATWMDKIREAGWNTQFHHHFVSNHWSDNGAAEKVFNPSYYANASFAIQDAATTLSSLSIDTFGSSKSIFGKSISMRVLVHLLGDIHQPLHNSERVTPSRPDGDSGGNFFKISHYNSIQMDNLHFIWDEMFRPISETIRSNLPKEKYLFVKERAESIMSEYPLEQLLPQIQANSTVDSWSQEGFDLAKNFVYKGIVEGQPLPEEYMKAGETICRQRVALGGYRLGMLIDTIYTQMTSNTAFQA